MPSIIFSLSLSCPPAFLSCPSITQPSLSPDPLSPSPNLSLLRDMHKKKQIPCITSMLTKDFYLDPKAIIDLDGSP